MQMIDKTKIIASFSVHHIKQVLSHFHIGTFNEEKPYHVGNKTLNSFFKTRIFIDKF